MGKELEKRVIGYTSKFKGIENGKAVWEIEHKRADGSSYFDMSKVRITQKTREGYPLVNTNAYGYQILLPDGSLAYRSSLD